MPTQNYKYLLPVSDPASQVTQADFEKIAQGLEDGRTWGDGEYIGPGFYLTTDFTGTVIPGVLGVQASAGRCNCGLAGGGIMLVKNSGVTNVQNGLNQAPLAGGLVTVVASVVNYFFLNTDGSWTVNTTGTNPGNGAQLAFTSLMGGAQASSIDNNPPGRLPAMRRIMAAGRPNTGHIRIAVNPTDADIVTIKVGDLQVVFEWDNNAAVTAGRILVTIGASAALSAVALAAAINAQMPNHVTAAVHATDTTIIDLIIKGRGQTFTTLTESSAGARTVVRDNAEGLIQRDRQFYGLRRAIVAEDVTRTRVRVNTGLTNIDHYHYRFQTSVSNNAEIAYNGVVTITGGVIEFAAGGTNFAAGNILDLEVVGW